MTFELILITWSKNEKFNSLFIYTESIIQQDKVSGILIQQ